MDAAEERHAHAPPGETAVSMPESKKLLRILEEHDIYMVFYKLKQQDLKSPLWLDDAVLERLSEYIREYTGHVHAVDTGFGVFMGDLMKKIQPASIDLHIRCLSHLHDVDLDHFRGLYGYSKIYQCFKATIAGMFTRGTDHKHIEMLIRLLDNNQLVYKNMLPIVTRLSSYVTNDIVDKNIAACCSVLDAVVRHCPDRFPDVLIVSLLGYLAKLLHTPQNFLFLRDDDTAAVSGALKTLSRFAFRDFGVGSTARGLLRECIGKIAEYRNSTVYEEVLVVVCMTDILSCLFDLCIRHGNRSLDFIEPDFLNFDIARSRLQAPDPQDRGASPEDGLPADPPAGKSAGCDFYKIAAESDAGQGAGSALEKTRLARLQSRFVEAKYLFLDCLDPLKECFDRVVFYNDLQKVENVIQLFRNICILKKKIDWSDLIVYACNARCRVSYIPIIFDDYYLRQASHPTYLQIFLNSLKERPEDLVPFTRAAVDRRCDFILMEIYFAGVENRPIVRKTRNDILRYVIDYEEDEEAEEKDEKFITRLKNRLSLEKKDEEGRSGIERIVRGCIEKLTFRTPSRHVAALFLVFMSKKIRVPAQMLLYKHMKECLDGGEGCLPMQRAYACLCVLILNQNALEIFDVEDKLTSVHDAIIALLSYRTSCKKSEPYLKRIKEDAFGLLFCASAEQLAEVGALSGHGSVRFQDSVYFKEFCTLNEILNPEAQEAEETPCSVRDPGFG